MIKGFLFDLDGVIVDTAVFHFQAWRRIAQKLGGDFSKAQNEQLKGVSRVDSLTKILEWTGTTVTEKEFKALMELKNEWYLELVTRLSDKDGLPGAVDFLHQPADRRHVPVPRAPVDRAICDANEARADRHCWSGPAGHMGWVFPADARRWP